MNAYYVILIGLTSAIVLIAVYAYVDYMSGRHISDMYNGLRGMMDGLKERIRILEDTVKDMEKRNESIKIIEDGYKAPAVSPDTEGPLSGAVCLEKKKRTTISQPEDLIEPKF